MIMQLRPLFHRMLHRQVQRFDIEITYGKRIVEYYEDSERGVGGVVTDQGEREEADLVIAADGLGSHSQEIVLGGQGKGKPSGRSKYTDGCNPWALCAASQTLVSQRCLAATWF